jgi:hypothetical protein
VVEMKATGWHVALASSRCERMNNGDVWHSGAGERVTTQLG